MITGRLLASLRPNAVFVNTSRGLLVRQDELAIVAAQRSDLQFILDVTDPEPLPTHSPLFSLPNVKLTPHNAGSVGPECRRLDQAMVEELGRHLRGEPLKWAVHADAAQHSAHGKH